MAPKWRAAPKVSSSKAASKSTKASKKLKKPQFVKLSSDDNDDDNDNAITCPKTKHCHQKWHTSSSASSDAEVDEEQPRKKKKQRKEVNEPSEDLSWMDRQETLPPQEQAEDEPEEGTLAWCEWNLCMYYFCVTYSLGTGSTIL